MPEYQMRLITAPNRKIFRRKSSSAASLTLIFLLIEFFDELHFGIHGAALPSIRTSLGLNYYQVGLLLGLPSLVNTIIEPVLMILGDTNWRRHLIAFGGLALSLSLLLFASASAFSVMLIASILAFPATGAFVSLSQASLIDQHPSDEAQMIARWTVFGSIGNLSGPLLVAGAMAIALSWRWLFASLCVLAAGLTLSFWARSGPPTSTPEKVSRQKTYTGLSALPAKLWLALHQRELMRWTGLLLASDLLLDTFTGYLALYLIDSSGFTASQASLAFGVCMLTSLAADLGLIPLLKRYNGRDIVRLSARLAIAFYPIWLLVSSHWVKIFMLVAVRLATIGWYPVLKSEAFRSYRENSGVVMAVDSLAGLASGGITWGVASVASHTSLGTAMWLLLAGPVCLALWVPARHPAVETYAVEGETYDGLRSE
jgi:FSR family fosmidomycin resistance protein-like MFS transporter